MADQVDVNLGLDASGFTTGANQIASGAQSAQQSLNALATAHRAVTSVLGTGIPGKLAFAGFIAAAADAQQQMASLQSTQAVTGQSAKVLEGSVRSLARAFPVGQAGALQMVQTLQQLGISGKNQTGQISGLARDFIQLGGATGESATGLASMQIQLSRLYGNLDPSRISKMDDALVSVADHSGASASAVLSFSNAIGPLARAAGLGQTAVMGISAQMASLGQDGGGAATALNKVFSDLNQSVVTGSSQMANYARVVNMTAGQFKTLYQNDPSQAIEKVTQALAAPGAQGQRNLQSLGFDGVRTQVALQALSQSGGLTNAINTAVGSYGNGDTAKAAKPEFDTVEADLTKLATSAQIVAETLGGPFLKALALSAQAFTELLKPVAAVAGSRIVQGGLGAASFVLPAGIAALAGGKLLGQGALASRLFTSGVASSRRAGSVLSRGLASGDLSADATLEEQQAYVLANTRGGRRSAAAADMVDPSRRARGPLGRMNEGSFQAAMGYGGAGMPGSQTVTPGAIAAEEAQAEARAPYAYRTATADLGFVRRGFRRASQTAGLAVRTSLITTADPLYNAAQLPGDRGALPIVPGARPGAAMGAGGRDVMAGLRGNDITLVRGGLGRIGGAGSELLEQSGPLSNALKESTTTLARASASFGARAAGTIGTSLAGAATNPLLLATLAAPLAKIGFDRFEHRNDAAKSYVDETANGDINATTNAYADALGKAGVATTSFADIATTAATALGKIANVTPTSATTVSASDVTAGAGENVKSAQNRLGKQINSKASAQTIAAQLNATSVAGINPEEAQQMKLDLLAVTGGDSSKVSSILSGLNVVDPATASGALPTTRSTAQLFAGVQGAFAADPNKPLTTQASLSEGRAGGYETAPVYAGLSKSSMAAYQAALQGAGQNEQINAGAYGQNYATQQEFRQVSGLYTDTYNAVGGNISPTQNRTLLNAAARSLGGNAFHGNITAKDFTQAGGNLAIAMGIADPNFKKNILDPVTQAGGSFTGQGGLGANFQADATTTALAKTGSPLARFFTNNPVADAGGTAGAVANASNASQNQSAQVNAVSAILSSARDMHESFGDVAASAKIMSASLSDADGHLAALNQLLSVSSTLQTADASGRSSGEQASVVAQQGVNYLKASRIANNPNAVQDQTTGTNDVAQAQSDAEQGLQQQLTAYRSYLIQRQRAGVQFGIQEVRSAQDYGIQVANAEADNQKQILRSTQDYQTSRLRSQEDFNTQMQRTVEDAEKSLYDPYQRIQAQPVFDAGELLANLGNQAQAMQLQITNLQKIQAMGLSKAAVQALSLGATSNAQQLAQLVGDAASDPKVIAQLNAAVGKRGTLSKGLVENTANTDYDRQVADFNKSQTRAAQDFSRTMSRQADDFAISMSRQNQQYELSRQRSLADYQLSLSEAAQDEQTSLEQISGSAQQLAAAALAEISGKSVDFTKITVNGITTQITALKSATDDIAAYVTSKMNTAAAAINGAAAALSGATPRSSSAVAIGSAAAQGGSSGGGYATGNSATTDRSGKTTYVTPGTGFVVSGTTSATGASANYQPSAAFMKAHPVNVPFNKSIAKQMMQAYGWTSATDFNDVDHIFTVESGWNQYADNTTSSAYGIPQSLPGTNMSSAGADWDTNPATQIRYGLDYIKRRYGTPENAWSFHTAHGWYGQGSVFTGPQRIGVGEAGPEAVIPLNASGMNYMAQAMSKTMTMDSMRAMAQAATRSMTAGTGNGMMMMTSNDYRQSFAGANITIVSDNADQMAATLARRERTDALTAGRR